MLTNIRYILLTALRDFLFLGLLVFTVTAVAISATLGGTAMVEKEAMTLAFSGASARMILIFGLTVFVAFHIRQAFDQKEIDVLLSRPMSRFQIMLSYWMGFSCVSFLLALVTVAILSFLPILSLEGFFWWGLSLLLESWLMVAIVLFASFALSSAVTSVMAAMGLYIGGRMMAFFIATSDSHMVFHEQWVNAITSFIINTVSIIMPRLDLFTQSEWLVYGLKRPEDVTFAIVQAIIYIPLLLAAATIDFKRKEF